MTANLLRGFAVGPVGLRHPAEDNVDDFDLPLVNGVDRELRLPDDERSVMMVAMRRRPA